MLLLHCPVTISQANRMPRQTPGIVTLCLIVITALVAGCRSSLPEDYDVREGDILFQSLPHSPLVDTIEGVSRSNYSHCGIVARSDGRWIVIEAIGPVRETAISDWIAQGRGEWFAAYRMNPTLSAKIPEILTEARRYLGRPYDIHYSFDDARIYCSELILKAVKAATGCQLGKIERLGDLNWRPYEGFIRSIEGDIPLDREMITPESLSEAKELTKIYETR